jgi:DnaJ-class molecular chaperone
MAADPYTVLGLTRSATEEEVRRAFRRLAKELHPDVKPGDAAAAERFKQVSQAYDILGDAEKRAKFDRGEIDAAGEPRHGYASAGAGMGGSYGGGYGARGPADDLGFGDIFSEIFGGTRRGRAGGAFQSRGQDVRYTLDVDFIESILGARKRVTLPDGAVLDLNVPEGVEHGQVLRLKGKGEAGFGGGPAGDALVEIRVKSHPDFKRSGDDVLSTLKISIDEAVLGGKVEVPTVGGTVNLTIPKGTSSGRTFRLRGKGAHNKTSGRTGDQLVTVEIVMPDEIDDKLSYFMSEWRQLHRYNPRRK